MISTNGFSAQSSEAEEGDVKMAHYSIGLDYGAAIFGAAAGGGYPSVADAARRMGKLKDKVYFPDQDNALNYDQLYAEYELLHQYFGEGLNNIMKRLKALKKGL